ncbi:MAG: hypothetical protein KGI54_05990 [Pseudomonadota bacterium]|nr:hypothetical protein [Pseudomonadota bacterium]
MNKDLFQQLSGRLMLDHFGFGLNNIHFSEKQFMDTYGRKGMRPYKAVNSITKKYSLNRKSRPASFSGSELTEQDEFQVLQYINTIYLFDEEIMTCPRCSSRTDFRELEHGRQFHCCLNSSCGFEFIAEPESL